MGYICEWYFLLSKPPIGLAMRIIHQASKILVRSFKKIIDLFGNKIRGCLIFKNIILFPYDIHNYCFKSWQREGEEECPYVLHDFTNWVCSVFDKPTMQFPFTDSCDNNLYKGCCSFIWTCQTSLSKGAGKALRAERRDPFHPPGRTNELLLSPTTSLRRTFFSSILLPKLRLWVPACREWFCLVETVYFVSVYLSIYDIINVSCGIFTAQFQNSFLHFRAF